MPFQNFFTQIQAKKREFLLKREIISTFKRYKTHIFALFEHLNVSPQLINAIELSNIVLNVCEDIAKDPLFQTFPSLIHEVRLMDREITELIASFKYRFEIDNAEKFRVELKKDYSNERYILNTLKGIIQDFNEIEDLRITEERKQERIIAKKSSKMENDKELIGIDSIKVTFFNHHIFKYAENAPEIQLETNFLKKTKNWIYYKQHPEHVPENMVKIYQYRKKKPVQIKIIEEQKLPCEIEELVLLEVSDKFTELLENLENLGFYNHIIALSQEKFQDLEKLADSIKPPKYSLECEMKLVSFLRKSYRDLEQWIERFEIKYADKEKRVKNEPKIETGFIKKVISYYDLLRDAFIKRYHDRLILDKIRYIEKKERELEKKLAKAKKVEAKVDKQIEKERNNDGQKISEEKQDLKQKESKVQENKKKTEK